MNPGSSFSAFLTREGGLKSRDKNRKQRAKQRGAVRETPVLHFVPQCEAKDVPFPFPSPRARVLGEAASRTSFPWAPGPGPVPSVSLVLAERLLEAGQREGKLWLGQDKELPDLLPRPTPGQALTTGEACAKEGSPPPR